MRGIHRVNGLRVSIDLEKGIVRSEQGDAQCHLRAEDEGVRCTPNFARNSVMACCEYERLLSSAVANGRGDRDQRAEELGVVGVNTRNADPNLIAAHDRSAITVLNTAAGLRVY